MRKCGMWKEHQKYKRKEKDVEWKDKSIKNSNKGKIYEKKKKNVAPNILKI